MVSVTLYNFTFISATFGQILTIFNTTMVSGLVENNLISADFENINRDHLLQKSLYLSNYTTDFN